MPTAGVAPYNVIAIVNASTVMSDGDGVTIVAALNTLLPKFCNDWSLPPVTVVYVPKNMPVSNPLRCIVLDTSDVKDALGYHAESDDVPYAKVFVKTILQNRGEILYSTTHMVPTVAGTISHEVFEMLVDLRANVWWSAADGLTLYAAEVCDPVQSNMIKVVTKGGSTVGISDWILPTWADPQAKVGPFNHLNTLKKPFTMDKGGYLITIVNGTYTNVFASEITAYTTGNVSKRRINRTSSTTM